jgi:S-DNA-T family DNA segregation ATPase FtsK/SpoIIIE
LPALGTRVNKIKNLAEELALALNSDTCRVSRRQGSIAIEIPRPDPQAVRLLPLQRQLIRSAAPDDAWRPQAPQGQHHNGKGSAIPFGTALLGLSDDGAPLLVRLPSPQVAHLLLAGTTGSGKSALAQTIITSLALTHRPSQIGFILIDPKRRAFGPLAGLPHLLRPVLSEPQEALETLQSLVDLMLERDRESRRPADAGNLGEPRVVIVIDELADLLMSAGKEAQHALTRLAQRGREAGLHLVACTQKPASAVVGSLAKANFPVRLVGRVTSPEEAKVATGYAGTGAERLRGPGDFIAVVGGQVTRFQAAYVSSRELAEVVQALTHGGTAAWQVVGRPDNRHPVAGAVQQLEDLASRMRRRLLDRGAEDRP